MPSLSRALGQKEQLVTAGLRDMQYFWSLSAVGQSCPQMQGMHCVVASESEGYRT